jgi:hypothetical protein
VFGHGHQAGIGLKLVDGDQDSVVTVFVVDEADPVKLAVGQVG